MLAWQEIRRHAARLDARVLVVVALAVAAGALAARGGLPTPDPDQGIYLVSEPTPSFWHDAVAADARFRFVPVGGDLVLQGDEVHAAGTPRAGAALAAFEEAATRWLEEQWSLEDDQAAAFPVQVDVGYQPRTVQPTTDDAPAPPSLPPDPSGPPQAAPVDLGDEAQSDLRPSQLDPPFPIRSLLLTFAYVLPASLVLQVYASELHAERIRHRGTALLATPLTPARLFWGKTAPFALLLLLLAVAVTLLLGAGLLGFLAATAVLAFLLAGTGVAALAASNLRELTMLNVGLTTSLNVFLFLPAMFPALPPVAYLSPMHVVAVSIRDQAVPWAAFLYATLPITLAAVALVALCIGYLRDEALFGRQRGRTAMAAMVYSRPRLLAAGALAVPFAIAAELLLFVVLTVLGIDTAIALFLPAAVLVETAAKALPLWAVSHRTRRGAIVAGLLVGTGFFLAEKTALLLGLVGFADLPFGAQALALLGSGSGLVVLLAPLALHAATGVMLATSAHRGRAGLGLVGALVVHAAYDLVLIGGLT